MADRSTSPERRASRMALPRLWTRRRLAGIAGLAGFGVLQAATGLAVAAAGSQLMMGSRAYPVSIMLMAVLLAAAAAFLVLRVLQRRFAEAFALGYVLELRSALISHVIRVPPGSATIRFGMVMTRVVNDLSAIRLWLASGLVSIVVAAAMLVSMGAYLTWTDPRMALMLLPALAVWAVVVLTCLRPLERRIRKSRRERGRIAAKAGAILNARQTILLHGRHGQSVRAIERRSRAMGKAMIGRATFSGLLRASGDLVMPAVALTVAVGLTAPGSTALSAGDLGILIMLTGMVATQLNAVAIAADYRLAHRVAIGRLTRVLNTPAIDIDAGTVSILRDTNGRDLVVDDVPLRPTGRRVSFRALPGQHLSLTGLSELETQDLFAKIARLRDLEDGCILLDGCDREAARARDWWRTVALVSDTMSPIAGTVAKNATMGSPSSLSARERSRIMARFGLEPAAMNDRMGEDQPVDSDQAAAIRAVRGILRRPGLLLVEDGDVLARPELLDALLEEASSRGTTVLFGPGTADDPARRRHTIDLAAELRIVASSPLSDEPQQTRQAPKKAPDR